jgi:hypothetical protein
MSAPVGLLVDPRWVVFKVRDEEERDADQQAQF